MPPQSAACCQAGGAKLDHGVTPRLEGRLDFVPRLSCRRTSPAVMEGDEALRRLQDSPLWAAPLQWGWRGRVLGQRGAGLAFGKVLVPRGCRVPPTEPPLPAAPGVFQQDTLLWLQATVHPACPWAQGASPKAGEPRRVRLLAGRHCTCTAGVFPGCLS